VAVERPGVQAAEVADTRERDRQQPVEELPHPVAAQGHLRADRHALAQLEAGDGLAGAVHRGFWPVMIARSRIAPSSALESLIASPSPTLTTILVKSGPA
jgi:hypothetical protein